MQPHIEYATAVDGARIATLAFGEGEQTLLIAATPPWSHVLEEMGIPTMRTFLDAIGEHARVVRYDCRGTGLSDREGQSISLESQLLDLEAVVGHYALGSFALWGAIGGSPASITYTARNPERVSHLFLWGAYVQSNWILRHPVWAGMAAMLRGHWETFTDTYVQTAFGWGDSETGERYARLMRAAISQEAMISIVDQMMDVDVTATASRVRTPTLVMARRDERFPGADVARELAALIPTARLQLFEGSSSAPFLGDTAPVLTAIRAFMATTHEARMVSRPPATLSPREQQVLRLLANGRTGKEIAAELSISVATAQRHIANIYTKIGARGRVEAAAYAFEQGLAHPRGSRAT